MTGKFVLVKINGAGTFIFDFFPQTFQTTRRTNWEPQDTMLGVKPLLYGNREPRRISVQEVFIEKTDESIQPQIEELLDLQLEDPKEGQPPKLLALWGDRRETVILEEVTIEETWFSPEGDPQRAKVSMQLLEVQEDLRPHVSSTVRAVNQDSGSGIGDF